MTHHVNAATRPSCAIARRAAALLAALMMVALAAPRAGIAQEASLGAPGAAGTSSPSIEFPHLPHLTLQIIPSSGKAPLVVGFLVTNANPQSSRIVSYRWSFGDGTFSTLPPTLFFHTYTKPGSYVVQVTGTTSDGLNAMGFAGLIVR